MNPPFTIPGSAAIWLAIGWSVAVVGLLLLLWALFKDRAKGRLRCPRCWYDMSGARASEVGGAIDLHCPECGRDSRKLKRLRKTRRKWRLATVAMFVVLLGGAAASVPEVNKASKDGWWTVAPDWLLVRAVAARGWSFQSLALRSPELELHSRAVRGELSDGAVRAILHAPASVGLRAPKRWVEGEPLVVRVILSDLACLPRGLAWRVVDPQTGARIRPRQPIIRMFSDSLKAGESYSTQDWEFEIPAIAGGTAVVTVQALGAPPANGVIWSG